MAAKAASEGYHVKHTVDNYPWERYDGTVLDLGGSQGHVSIIIAFEKPIPELIIQELASMTPPAVSATIPPELESRDSLATHDFFDPQPVSTDLYLLRWTFHDWLDAHAVKMLQALVPASRRKSDVVDRGRGNNSPRSKSNEDSNTSQVAWVLSQSQVVRHS